SRSSAATRRPRSWTSRPPPRRSRRCVRTRPRRRVPPAKAARNDGGGKKTAMKKLSPGTLRRLGRAGRNSGFGPLVCVIALYIWFPYDRAKDAAVAYAAAMGYDVEIKSAGPAWGVGVSFSDILVKTRPTKPGEKPSRFTIENASMTTSVFSL